MDLKEYFTNGFLNKDSKILENYLDVVWGIKTESQSINKYKADNNERFRLYMKTHQDLIKFLQIIIPYTPTLTMIKKVLLLYDDAELQQRWISEIVSKTNYTYEQIETICKERKSQLKKYKSENDIVHFDKDKEKIKR